MPEAETKLEKNSHGSSVWAAFLIVAGITLLLNNLGLLPWQIWALAWKAWPILLVLGGIEIILGKTLASRILMLIVSLAVIILIFVYALSPKHRQQAPPNFIPFYEDQMEIMTR